MILSFQVKLFLLFKDLKNITPNKDTYPSPETILSGGENLIPSSLNVFLECVISKSKKSNNSKAKSRVKILAIANAIAEAALPNKIMSPVLFGIGVFLYRKYASKEGIEVLNALGFSSSYNEISNFERSTVLCQNISFDSDAVFQIGSDNADMNIDTIDGKNSFHVLGNLLMVCPSSSVKVEGVKRINWAEKNETVGEFGTLPIISHEPNRIGQVRKKMVVHAKNQVSNKYSFVYFFFRSCFKTSQSSHLDLFSKVILLILLGFCSIN